ncbi:prepilin-type N-terminal cleavage/methylation domain-containing protein [Planococcus donghaensis]|uniref:type IV pilus modification PilV family protein n=1 Tax=Planococcus donghaensis TaxID=414778 RepID=UPI003734F42C
MSMNDKGLTLVEVLAAVVILGILFVGIMSIFPQMTLFNAKTETKLDTMNLARQEMAELMMSGNKNIDGTIRFDVKFIWSNVLATGSNDPLSQDQSILKEAMLARDYNHITTDTAFLRFEKNDDFRFEADVYLSCEPFKKIDPINSGDIPCEADDVNKLFRVHLKVFNGQLLSSETYSYIKYDALPQIVDESAGG